LITCDIIPGRLKSCSVPFFDLNVELLMRTYIATIPYNTASTVLPDPRALRLAPGHPYKPQIPSPAGLRVTRGLSFTSIAIRSAQCDQDRGRTKNCAEKRS